MLSASGELIRERSWSQKRKSPVSESMTVGTLVWLLRLQAIALELVWKQTINI